MCQNPCAVLCRLLDHDRDLVVGAFRDFYESCARTARAKAEAQRENLGLGPDTGPQQEPSPEQAERVQKKRAKKARQRAARTQAAAQQEPTQPEVRPNQSVQVHAFCAHKVQSSAS